MLKDFTDMYFNRTKEILQKSNKSAKVLMQVFPRKNGVLCGINEVTSLIKKEDPLNKFLEVHALKEGSIIKENETVITIEGEFRRFVHLETVYLGILSRMSSIATNMKEIIDAAEDKEVIMMSARFERPEMQEFDGYAAYVGGCKKFSTTMNVFHLLNFNFSSIISNIEPVGTIPHALIAVYGGNTLEATLAFDKHIDPKVSRIALVDFENDCVKTSLEIAQALKTKLYAVRLDTSKGMVDESIKRKLCTINEVRFSNEFLKDEFGGVCPELVRQVRENLDKEGFNYVKIVVSGGFTAEKIRKFVQEKVPFDIVGVGSAIYNKRFDFTADIVQLNGKNCAKVGREYHPNKKLQLV